LQEDLPDFFGFDDLHILRLANNSFSGPISDLSFTPLLSDLDLGYNLLSGPLPTTIGTLQLLSNWRVPSNRMTVWRLSAACCANKLALIPHPATGTAGQHPR
jgi:hypothetical protein